MSRNDWQRCLTTSAMDCGTRATAMIHEFILVAALLSLVFGWSLSMVLGLGLNYLSEMILNRFRKRAGVREVIKIIAHFFLNSTTQQQTHYHQREERESFFVVPYHTIARRRKQLTENKLEKVIEYNSKEKPNRNAASNAISIALAGARKPFSASTIQDGFFSNASGSCQKVKDDGTSSIWRYLES